MICARQSDGTAGAEFFNSIGETERALECRRIAYQEAKAVDNWENDDGSVMDVADAVIAFVEDQLASGSPKAVGSGKLMLKGVINGIKRAQDAGYGTESKIDDESRLSALYTKLLEMPR
jgi:hypothetical protein